MKKETIKLVSNNKNDFVDDIYDSFCEEISNFLKNTLNLPFPSQSVKDLLIERKDIAVIVFYVYIYIKSIKFMMDYMNFDFHEIFNEIFKIVYGFFNKKYVVDKFELLEDEIHEDIDLIISDLMNFYGIDTIDDERIDTLINSIYYYHVNEEKKIINADKNSIIYFYNVNFVIYHSYYIITKFICPKIVNIFFGEDIEFLTNSQNEFKDKLIKESKLFPLVFLICFHLYDNGNEESLALKNTIENIVTRFY
jgi:hypothetical protein